ncbi:MAG TPA: helix-turn-helix transcriptional regulator [Terracidiphilus sp.]|jgi:ribosome-binding protein aMBF1 (putative translation factor)|nr:helix-turn-helix transcriptional regulator [Terracidiphilus sp.]
MSVLNTEIVLKVRGLIVIKTDSIFNMVKTSDAQIKQRFGERVRELRKEKGLSQEGLALACDLDRTYVGGVERGERNVSLLNIRKIADALSVSARELF